MLKRVLEISTIKSANYNFVIFQSPNETNLPAYVQQIIKTGPRATVWIRACQEAYSDDLITSNGVKVYELPFSDGSTPPKDIMRKWLSILKDHKGETMAVHCLAGLGRGPLLVGVALIEDGDSSLEAVKKIRLGRPGALNLPQIKFLEGYVPKSRKPCLLL